MQIYLARNNVQAGPYNLEQVNNMLMSGEVVLTDIIWHEGMDTWQVLGELTQGQNFYNPHKKNKVELIDNAVNNENENNQRLTVEQLYGRKPKKTDQPENIDKQTHVINIKIDPLKIKDESLAGFGTRILATLIDWITFSMIFVPLMMRINLTDITKDLKGGQETNIIELQNQIRMSLETLPSHIVTMTSIFILAFFMIQTVLLVRQGQTLGKFFMGIRILDFKTHKLASVTNIMLLRTFVTLALYNIGIFGLFFICIDFIFMMINKNRRSIHDKIAGTYVVKVHPDQVKKISPENK